MKKSLRTEVSFALVVACMGLFSHFAITQLLSKAEAGPHSGWDRCWPVAASGHQCQCRDLQVLCPFVAHW